MIVDQKNIFIYGEAEESVPLIIYHAYEGDGKNVYDEIKKLTDTDFIFATITDIDWNDEMSPWDLPPRYLNDGACTGGADKYIKKLTEDIIPKIKAELKAEPAYIAISGYSLAGLFSIYSLFNTDIFECAVSASGSLWFPDFSEYVNKHSFKKRPKKVYFSLGDKEANTRNQLLSTVKDKTGNIYQMFRDQGIYATFELNPGNHFKDPDYRMAKGIEWILDY